MRSDPGTVASERAECPSQKASGAAVGGEAPWKSVARPAALLVMAGYYGTLSAVRVLGRQGIPVHVADPHRLTPARWSRYATRDWTCPSPEGQPERFVDWLLAVGEREPGQVLLPTTDETAWLFARHRADLARHYRMSVPPFAAVDSLLNKWRLAKACAAVEVQTPPTWLAAGEDDLPRLQALMDYPVMVKPQTQVLLSPHLKGLLVEEPGALVGRYSAVRNGTRHARPILEHDPGSALPLIQTFMGSRDGIYSLSGFVDSSGQHSVMVASRKVLQRPRRAGVGLCFEEDVVRPELADKVLRLCRHVGYHGVFEAEFLDAGGQYLLIDFNPRFYGQMSFDVDRGLDLPTMAYLQALGDGESVAALVSAARRREEGEPLRYWCNSIQLRTFMTLCLLIGGVNRGEWRRWRRWFVAHGRKATDAVTSPDDLRPAVAELALTLHGILRHPRAFLREARG